MPLFNSKSNTPLSSGGRKRDSTAFDCIVLDEDTNELNQNGDNLDDEDDDDLNYAANMKMAKRLSMQPCQKQTQAGPSTTAKAKELAEKQSIANRIDRICEYAQVLMHCLLYKINYYDKKAHFNKYIKYNIVVYVINSVNFRKLGDSS